MRTQLWAIVVAASITAACSGSNPTPTSPSKAQAMGTSGGGSPTSNNNDPEIQGTITALPPTTAALTFTVAGKTVVTTSSTVFVDGGIARTFADLKLGMKVEVKGTLSGNTLTATLVQLEDVDEPEPGEPKPPTPTPPAPTPPTPTPVRVELRGVISGLMGSASSFQFTLGTTLVKGDASTRITGGSQGNDDAAVIKDEAAKTFADLKNGLTVEVNGTQQTGFVQALQIHIEEPENQPGNEAEAEGTLGKITGTCPAISSTVGTTKFTTTASTIFDDVACTSLTAGMKVEIKGTRNADGSITATKVERED